MLTPPSVFKPIYLTIILPDTQKLTRPTDRKVAVISFTKALSDSPAFVSRYPKGWGLTCEALLKILINPPVASKNGVGFTQLNTCRKVPRDDYPDVGDVRGWVGAYLKEADGRNGGRIGQFVKERLGDEARATLMRVMGA